MVDLTQPCNIFNGNLYQTMVKWGAGRQACRGEPHLGVARAQGSREPHMSEVGHRRRAGAEDGAGASGGSSEEVVEGIFGTIEPLQFG